MDQSVVTSYIERSYECLFDDLASLKKHALPPSTAREILLKIRKLDAAHHDYTQHSQQYFSLAYDSGAIILLESSR